MKKNKGNEFTNERNYVNQDFSMNELNTTPGLFAYLGAILISLVLVAIGVYFIIKIDDQVERYICGVGLIFVAICIYFMSMAGQKSANYRFEFVPNHGLKGFVLFYKDRQIQIDYKLDKYGRFMWGDYRHKAKCITYADGTTEGIIFNNFTKYRIMNYLNGFLALNDLLSKDAY